MIEKKTELIRAGWEPLPPEPLPRPTYFPSGMALGTTLIFWGLISSWIIVLAGVGLFIVALTGWISDIRHERTDP